MFDFATSRRLIAVSLLAAASTVVGAQKNTIPLSVTFGTPLESYGISGDGAGPYIHRAEGREPTVVLEGNLTMDTRRSTRQLCFEFGPAADPGPAAALAPANACAPVLFRTLTRADLGAVGGLDVGEELDFGLDLYWTGPGVNGGTYQYVIAYKRVDGNGLWVTHPDANTWTAEAVISGRPSVGIVSVYLKGKSGGWNRVGTYDMPVAFTAVRAD
jgi:hypothetical protein